MTQTIHKSTDSIVEIVITNNDQRYPRHNYKTAIMRMRPVAHTRCRLEKDGSITLMPNFSDIRGLLQAIQACDPTFQFEISQTAKDKPEARKQYHWQQNQVRIERNRNDERR